MNRQLQLLKRLNAPAELVRDFAEKCSINDRLDPELRASLSELLDESCRKHGFQEILDNEWFFRPFRLSGPHHRADDAVTGDEPEAATVEQAYRRGFDQGYADCRRRIEDRQTLSQIKAREKAIRAWRVRNIQKYRSLPGEDEKTPRNLFGGRSGIAARVRWEVFRRDGFKCIVCGVTANDGARLEVDHIHPVSRGGSDLIENLRTLCRLCNVGKSDSI